MRREDWARPLLVLFSGQPGVGRAERCLPDLLCARARAAVPRPGGRRGSREGRERERRFKPDSPVGSGQAEKKEDAVRRTGEWASRRAALGGSGRERRREGTSVVDCRGERGSKGGKLCRVGWALACWGRARRRDGGATRGTTAGHRPGRHGDQQQGAATGRQPEGVTTGRPVSSQAGPRCRSLLAWLARMTNGGPRHGHPRLDGGRVGATRNSLVRVSIAAPQAVCRQHSSSSSKQKPTRRAADFYFILSRG
jgi:hypothetical protein